MAPFAAPIILTNLRTSAEVIISKCTGDEVGKHCNYQRRNSYSKQDDAMEAMAVLAAVSNLLIEDAPEPIMRADEEKGIAEEGGDDSAAMRFGSSLFFALASVCALGWNML